MKLQVDMAGVVDIRTRPCRKLCLVRVDHPAAAVAAKVVLCQVFTLAVRHGPIPASPVCDTRRLRVRIGLEWRLPLCVSIAVIRNKIPVGSLDRQVGRGAPARTIRVAARGRHGQLEHAAACRRRIRMLSLPLDLADRIRRGR